MTVSIVRRSEDNSIRKAVELCDGFKNLKATDKVVLKPNIVGGPKTQKPDGLVVTVSVMDEIIKLLKEYGCKDITIAEGGMIQKELGLESTRAFQWSGIKELAQGYDIPIVDNNEGPFREMEIDGEKVEVAETVLNCDFLINIPVLKTHQLSKISLGMKNVKGAISHKTKQLFHEHNLERFIGKLNTLVQSDLVIIDGTFGVQRGPVGRDIHEMDVVVAGREILEVDAVGAAIMGIHPQSVVHLQVYGVIMDKELDLDNIEIVGEEVKTVRKKLEWQANWTDELLAMHNVKGVTFEAPFYSNCSGCGMGVWLGVHNFLREHKGATFDGIQICVGREPEAFHGMKKVFLLGKCAIANNKNHPNSIEIKGCPPKAKDIYEAMTRELI